MKDSKQVVLSGFLWKFFERCGAQLVTFTVSIVLARILAPEVYGIASLVLVIINILEVFVNSGFGSALIQKKDADDTDFSSVFYFNLAFGLTLYVLLYFAAPMIATFYKIPEICKMVRVVGLEVIVFSVKNIQHVYVSKHMLFKKFFFSTLIGTITAAVVGIIMALNGCGVWALIAQYMINSTVDTIVVWITVPWRPKWLFSFSRLKKLISYGWKMLASGLLDTLNADLRDLLIGKFYSTSSLAFYNKGKQLSSAFINNINTSIGSVLFPSMAKIQDDIGLVKRYTQLAIKTCTFIIMPMMAGLAACAEPLVLLLLGEKWLPCVPFIRVFCFTSAFLPVHTSNLNAIQALGRSDLFLKLEIEKKAVGLIFLLITLPISPIVMAYGVLVSSICSQIINASPNKKLLDYHYLEQLKDMLPQISLSLLMGVVVFCVSLLKLSPILTLVIQIPLGVLLYIGGAYIFKIDSLEFVFRTAKQFLKKDK